MEGDDRREGRRRTAAANTANSPGALDRIESPSTSTSSHFRFNARRLAQAHCFKSPKMSTILRTLRNLRRVGLKVGSVVTRCCGTLLTCPLHRTMATKCRYALPQESTRLGAINWFDVAGYLPWMSIARNDSILVCS